MYSRAATLVLRLAVAVAFLYPPYAALQDPISWLSYFPQWFLMAAHTAQFSDMVVLHGFGVVEVVIALWILSGWRVYIPATLAMLVLLAIVGFDYQNFDVLFRDISIALAAGALALQALQDHTRRV